MPQAVVSDSALTLANKAREIFQFYSCALTLPRKHYQERQRRKILSQLKTTHVPSPSSLQNLPPDRLINQLRLLSHRQRNLLET